MTTKEKTLFIASNTLYLLLLAFLFIFLVKGPENYFGPATMSWVVIIFSGLYWLKVSGKEDCILPRFIIAMALIPLFIAIIKIPLLLTSAGILLAIANILVAFFMKTKRPKNILRENIPSTKKIHLQ